MSIPGPRGRCGILAVALIPMVAIGLRGSPVGSPGSPPAQDASPTLDAATRRAGADEAWWQAVSIGLERQEYEAAPGERGLEAPNRAQNLRTQFGPRGIGVGPRAVEPRGIAGATTAWRFGWETAALGRPGRMTAVTPASPQATGSRVTYSRPGFCEWYENTPAGLEQGFTIDRRPPGEGPLRIAGRLATGLAAELHDGEVDFFDARGARVLRYGKLAAFDANRREVPSKIVLEEAGTLVIEVDDCGAPYPLTVDPLMTSPAWTAEGDQAFAVFGHSVATAGDVNGDGFSDVIVGAYSYDNGQTDEGRAFVYQGSAAGLATTSAWTAEGEQIGAGFGYSVATAGDVNGDGFSDVIVGAYGYSNGQAAEGRAFVYQGSAAGLATTPAWTAEGDQEVAEFGRSVATAGDVNGDGFSDIIVGAYRYSNGQGAEGRAFVYQGSAAGLATTSAWTAEGEQVGVGFGATVATAGDVNGDGFSDVIVGAAFYDNGETDEGRAFVYHGSAAGLPTTSAWTAESDQASAEFGVSVATAGDVNGDGFSDVIVGAPFYDNGQINEGRAFVYRGSAAGLATTSAWTAEGEQIGAVIGYSVAAGDVNGDGFSDVIVGAPGYDNGQTNEGRAFVYHGSAAGLSTTAAWTAEGDQDFAEFGRSVATAGDVNGDGFSDVSVGAQGYDNGQTNEGRAFVYHGGSGGLSLAPAWFTNGGQNNAGWGWSVGTAGDVNGDGYSDIIAVADRYDNGQADEGKAWVYHGSRTGVPVLSGWSAETNQFNAQLSSAASAGDVNGDGYTDVILGSYRYDNGENDEGRTFLYLGSFAGLSPTPAWTSEPNQASAWFGSSVGSAGDVNGDGYGDVLVGGDGWDNGQSSEGRAWLYLGSAGGLGGPIWSVEGDQEGASLGYSVGTAGDVNGDGFSDVLIAVPGYDNGEPNEGVVWVFHGSDDGLGVSPSRVVEVNQAGALFGFDVSTAGDVNGDGFSDVIIGAQSYDGLQTDAGRAFVYHGGAGGLGAAPAWTDEPNQASAQYGRSVATAGDVNGDGYSDVIVGASHMDVGAFNDGAVWVYHGSPAGLAPAWFNYGGQTDAFFGIAVGTAGDVNGDGFSDVIIGAFGYDYNFTDEGGVWVFLGNQGAGLDRVRLQLRTDGTAPIDLLGRSDSESEVHLTALARTPAGRGRVRLEVEMKPAGTPFDGTGLVTSAFGNTGAPGVGGSAVSFIQDVTGLAPGTLYHWRLRIASDSPFFPRSPWLWLPYNGVTEGDVRTGGDPTTAIAEGSAPPPAGLWLGRAAPNPFTTSTELNYTLPHHAMTRLGVFNVQGRQVATLAEGAKPAGRHRVHWDGQDAGGSPLPAGVYFVRLEFAGHVVSQKIVRSR